MGGPLPLGFFIGGPFNAAQHIARQPAPQCLAPWPPGRGRQTCFGPSNILKGTRDHICLNPSAMLCFHTLSCTNFSDSRQTPVPRGHYCVTSAMFFRTNLSDSLRHPGCECSTLPSDLFLFLRPPQPPPLEYKRARHPFKEREACT